MCRTGSPACSNEHIDRIQTGCRKKRHTYATGIIGYLGQAGKPAGAREVTFLGCSTAKRATT